MASDLADRKSASGAIFFLGRSLISWQSQKQRLVALFSCEAEYIAGSIAACQGIWLVRMVGELLGKGTYAFKVLIDNKSATSHGKNPVLQDRSNHIDLRYHYGGRVHPLQ
uniref:Predicted protein n=1 Tax=Hordeum vulgare subsp. vulgare TaxID=112509 RepID=F2EIH7_HORVV|nr:predicted protein [Hordeum vulgare subsp. vulgare]